MQSCNFQAESYTLCTLRIVTASIQSSICFFDPIVSCNNKIYLAVSRPWVFQLRLSPICKKPLRWVQNPLAHAGCPFDPFLWPLFLLFGAWRPLWLRLDVVLICLPRLEWRPARRTLCRAAAAAGNKPNSWPHFASLKTFYYTVICPAVWWAVTLWAMSPYRMLMNWNDKIIMCCWTHQYHFFFNWFSDAGRQKKKKKSADFLIVVICWI